MVDWKIYAHDMEYIIGLVCFLGSMFAWYYPTLFFHECGHALAAYFLGFTPKKIIIGAGEQVLFTFQLRTMQFEIKDMPFGGITHLRNLPFTNGARLKKIIVVGAGPLADAMVLLCLSPLVIYLSDYGNKTLGKIAVGVFVTQFFSLFVSLIPRNIRINGVSRPNDAKRIWLILTGKDRNEMQLMVERVAKVLVRYYDQNYQPNPSSGLFTGDGALLHKYFDAKELLEKKQFDNAVMLFEEILSSELLQNAERACVLDWMARLPIIYDQKQYLAKAFSWIEEARRLAPSALTLDGTYGSLLIESGQIDQGIEVLKKVFDAASQVLVKAMVATFLSDTYRYLDDQEQAERWSKKQSEMEAQLEISRQAKATNKSTIGFAGLSL
jgi:tetratricopeptide (TPR) repeat protein